MRVGLVSRASGALYSKFTIAAPLQSFGGEDLFPTDIEKIARIGFGLASNHAFIDGNKRIGAMVVSAGSAQPIWVGKKHPI